MRASWYPFFVVDYRRDTYHLSLAEDGAYRRLIDEYMLSREPLPDDDGALARILGIPPSDWLAIAPRLRKFFRPRAGRLQHKRCEQELRAQELRAKHLSERSKKSASTRKSKNKGLGSSRADVLSCSVVSSPPLDPSPRTKQSESGAARASDDWPVGYRDEFWAKYPHKVGKGDALAKLERARAKVAWAELTAALDRYIAKTDDRPWCNPATWLHQERWADQPSLFNGGQHGKPRQGSSAAGTARGFGGIALQRARAAGLHE